MIKFGYTPQSFIRHEAPGEGGQANSGGTNDAAATELAAFKELGLSPQQLDGILEDYVRLAKGQSSRKTDTQEPPAKKKDGGKPVFADEEAAKEAFLKMFPHLAKGQELEERLSKQEERTNKLHRSDVGNTKEASRREVLRYVTGTLGAEIESAQGQKFLDTVLRLANDRLTGNVDALQAFIDGDKAVIRNILQDMAKDGIFESMKVPTAKRVAGQRPWLSGTDGNNTAVKEKLEANREKYSKLAPSRRWLEMSKDIYDEVFPQQ